MDIQDQPQTGPKAVKGMEQGKYSQRPKTNISRKSGIAINQYKPGHCNNNFHVLEK